MKSTKFKLGDTVRIIHPKYHYSESIFQIEDIYFLDEWSTWLHDLANDKYRVSGMWENKMRYLMLMPEYIKEIYEL